MADSAELTSRLVELIADATGRRVEGYAARVEQVYQHVVPKDTGRLASAFSTSTTPLGGGVWRLHGEVDDDVAPYGKWLDDPPAEIVPTQARALHWFNRSSGAEVFARRVVPSRVHEGWWQRFVDLAVESLD